MRLASSVGVYQYTIVVTVSRWLTGRKVKKKKRRKKLTKQRHHARPRAALKETQEDAQHVDLLRVLAQRDEARHEAPADLQPRQPPARSHPGHDDLAGDEHDAVRDAEVGREVVELVAVEAEVLLHARHVRVADVGLVEVLDDLRHAAKRHEEDVQPPHEVALEGGALAMAAEEGHALGEEGLEAAHAAGRTGWRPRRRRCGEVIDAVTVAAVVVVVTAVVVVVAMRSGWRVVEEALRFEDIVAHVPSRAVGPATAIIIRHSQPPAVCYVELRRTAVETPRSEAVLDSVAGRGGPSLTQVDDSVARKCGR